MSAFHTHRISLGTYILSGKQAWRCQLDFHSPFPSSSWRGSSDAGMHPSSTRPMSLRESWPHLYPQRQVWMVTMIGLEAQVKANHGMTSVWLWEWAIPAKTAVRNFAGRWLRRQFLIHKRWLLDQTLSSSGYYGSQDLVQPLRLQDNKR